MSRLTEYHCGVAVIKNKELLKEAMAKLAHYEDLAEQGKLLELKYKPGTPAYRVEKYSIGQEWVHTGYDHMGELGYYRNIDRYQIKNIQITLHNMDEVGRNIFLTEAEAKKEKEKRESWEG